MSIERDDLRVRRTIKNDLGMSYEDFELATDEDLAALGYVRLDVDKAIIRATEALCDYGLGRYPIDVVNGLARMAVLAALDGEET